jgi:hypothetical protein
MAVRLLVLLVLVVLAGPARAQEGKKGDTAPVGSKTKPLADPPEKLAKLLAVYDKEPEPQRECKRLFASSLYYLLDRDIERFLLCFHKDFEIHQGLEVMKLPPAELRGLVEKRWSELPKSPLRVEELVELEKARAYSKEQAKKWIGDWKKEPSEIAKVMADGDYLVIAPTNKKALGDKATDFEAEIFYVMRQESGIWKIVLGE